MKTRSNLERFVDVFDADLEISRLHKQLLTLQRAWPKTVVTPSAILREMARLHEAIDSRVNELRGLGTTKNPGGVQ